MDDTIFVRLDMHKATVCVATAESGRGREIRQVGVFENRPEILVKAGASGSREATVEIVPTTMEAGPTAVTWAPSTQQAGTNRRRPD